MNDAMEQTSAKPVRSVLLWAFVVAFILFFIWAYVYRVDQTTRGIGSVISSSRVQVIQAVDGGVLQSLKVKEGDRVRRGQVVALLDQTRSGASVRELDARLAAMKAQSARLRAEVLGSPSVAFPPELRGFPELVKVQQALFDQRRQSLREELRTLDVAVKLAREDAHLVAQLAKTGDVSRSEVIRSERALNDAEAQLINRKNKYYQDASAELAKIEDEINQNEQVRTQRNQQLFDSVMKTPVDGIVKNVRVTTQGGVLRSGEELMQIVPLDDKLIIETKVKPSDIAQIRPGLPAAIRFDAFDYTIHGAVDGTVAYVSADTIKEESKAGEQTYYRVHVEIAGSNPVRTRTGKQLDIIPGMTAQVDIRTGSRTVLDYLLKPLRKTMTESMGER
ncbi:HlyD family type I secretion periplasmic adaptor subunit [Geobacter sulfurreducens]|jgi:adhesin transport system membrane fusion protein|uniref:Efflux pump, RND family, membrane fusion protein n=1 Tax=Geobacter sulfurreducens (strain ATCC 51573 / DSM 12127 / PCA) TaxID=243231 RepID=Q74GH0_GEOSL|nr:HlyD family type I secretion periplasmic adaptor subunit [Geobacter sulfurreducens]AAR33610.1 efflux pump, RND family, membrane fusion protein [Geobacter sulfurreducens PCA]ADI83110.1 efflux pump, RND family, membrane fusion protein [Geobacter sulfurreducens KN400]AJY70004.1 hemolysin secretion protein D [Geobacter sulfurreducens]QVW35544.1 HlyD family type I secretion periplasmic adaptor subunit [Geobacter sulfurreducens]UAC04367.1 HlyD family type I secretion periplasmic adaptor subunit [